MRVREVRSAHERGASRCRARRCLRGRRRTRVIGAGARRKKRDSENRCARGARRNKSGHGTLTPDNVGDLRASAGARKTPTRAPPSGKARARCVDRTVSTGLWRSAPCRPRARRAIAPRVRAVSARARGRRAITTRPCLRAALASWSQDAARRGGGMGGVRTVDVSRARGFANATRMPSGAETPAAADGAIAESSEPPKTRSSSPHLSRIVTIVRSRC
jgi:hypothetical protein